MRSPSACAPTATCCRRRSTRQRLDAAFLADELAARVQDLGSPAAEPDRAAAAVRPDPGNAEAGRKLAAGERAAAPARRVVRPRRPRGAAGAGNARRRLRSDRPAGARSMRSMPRSRRCAATARTQLSADRPGRVLGRDRRPHRARGELDRHARQPDLRAAAVGRLPQLEGAAAGRAAAGQRRAGRARRGGAAASTACTASPSRSASP